MASFIKGMLCPKCNNRFQFYEAKTKSLSLRGDIVCPFCDAELQNPDHLRNIFFYLRVFLVFVLCFLVLIALVYKWKLVGMVAAVPVMFIFTYYLKNEFRLDSGYICMVERND